MSLFDEINRGTKLPKPRAPAQFVSIDSSSDDDDSSSPKITNRICKPRNPNLYNPDPQEYVNRDKTDDFLDYNQITSSILETNGGDSHSNKAIEKRWKAQVKQNQSRKENHVNENTIAKIPTGLSKKSSGDSQYKNNPLMRHLLEKKMAELQICNSAPSSSNGGKEKNENNVPVNDAMLIANPDDPEIFFLRDTSKRTEFLDDGFRFEHRGTKKTMTPRQYLIREVDDDDFIFKK